MGQTNTDFEGRTSDKIEEGELTYPDTLKR